MKLVTWSKDALLIAVSLVAGVLAVDHAIKWLMH